MAFICCTLKVSAQDSLSKITFKKSISINPFALLGTDLGMDKTLKITGEYRLRKQLALQTEAGFIFSSNYFNPQVEKRSVGFSIAPSVRLYYGKRMNNYSQVQLSYRRVTYTLYDWLQKDCVNNVPAYEQLQYFKFRKNVFDFNMITGMVLPLTRNRWSSRWFMDVYGGLGIRYKRQGVINQPNACYDPGFSFFGPNYDDKLLTLNIPVGIKLTYIIKK